MDAVNGKPVLSPGLAREPMRRVENVYDAIRGRKVIIGPNSPSEWNIVAFIEENGAPIELIQVRR